MSHNRCNKRSDSKGRRPSYHKPHYYSPPQDYTRRCVESLRSINSTSSPQTNSSIISSLQEYSKSVDGIESKLQWEHLQRGNLPSECFAAAAVPPSDATEEILEQHHKLLNLISEASCRICQDLAFVPVRFSACEGGQKSGGDENGVKHSQPLCIGCAFDLALKHQKASATGKIQCDSCRCAVDSTSSFMFIDDDLRERFLHTRFTTSGGNYLLKCPISALEDLTRERELLQLQQAQLNNFSGKSEASAKDSAAQAVLLDSAPMTSFSAVYGCDECYCHSVADLLEHVEHLHQLSLPNVPSSEFLMKEYCLAANSKGSTVSGAQICRMHSQALDSFYEGLQREELHEQIPLRTGPPPLEENLSLSAAKGHLRANPELELEPPRVVELDETWLMVLVSSRKLITTPADALRGSGNRKRKTRNQKRTGCSCTIM